MNMKKDFITKHQKRHAKHIRRERQLRTPTEKTQQKNTKRKQIQSRQNFEPKFEVDGKLKKNAKTAGVAPFFLPTVAHLLVDGNHILNVIHEIYKIQIYQLLLTMLTMGPMRL